MQKVDFIKIQWHLSRGVEITVLIGKIIQAECL